ncbi:MAG TPA: hypothetical protein V6D15_05750 [Oculatellaceae cyanobacterium]|jgi:hypothetical protein
MNAIQPSFHPLQQPTVTRRRVRRTSPTAHRQPYRAVSGETTAKLFANIVISSAAVSGLVQLLPYQVSQQTKLQEIKKEVQRSEKRVTRLSSTFNRHFDPEQSQVVMKEQSNRVAPSQRRVILLDKDLVRD